MTAAKFIMPLTAYMSGLESLEKDLEHLEFVVRENCANLGTETIIDISYAIVSIDQYRDFLVGDISSALVGQDNNIKLTDRQAMLIQTYQSAMNDALEILRTVHNICLGEN
tara:strand:- start:329 stop:661 length:333 start_codon:yes stop_codon:yes gene_type:complete